MAKVTGFMEFDREKQPYRPVEEQTQGLAPGHGFMAGR